MAPQYHDSDWLYRRYVEDGLTQREIADLCGVSPRTIRTYMNRFGIKARETVGENHPLHGTERSKETKEKISKTLEGRTFSEESRKRMSMAHKGNEISDESRRKISESLTGITRSLETRLAMSESTSGEANPRWKDGRFHNSWYGGSQWPQSRNQVRRRDEVCQYCGDDGTETPLDVHHIVPIRFFEIDRAMSVEDAHHPGNLILLCRSCHKRAEHGGIAIEPDFEELSDDLEADIHRLWKTFQHAIASDEGSEG